MAEVGLQQIGEYSVTGLLRENTTSQIYTGKLRKKDVFIKRLTVPLVAPQDKKALLTRAKHLKKLKDRTIVNIVDAGFDGDYGYLVMDTIPGIALNQRIKTGERLAADEAKRYLSPVANALHYAHVNNVVHGNLQPGNLFVDDHNGILLAEFSLTPTAAAFVLDDEQDAIPYMAPEHLQGQASAASDQYSLAVIIYELLCGRRPYQETEREPLLEQQLQGEFPQPRSLNKAISVAVERVILQALNRDPAQRFAQTQAFATAYLSALLGLPIKSPEIPRTVPITPRLNDIVARKLTGAEPAASETVSEEQAERETVAQQTVAPKQDKRNRIIPVLQRDNKHTHSTIASGSQSEESAPLESKDTQTNTAGASQKPGRDGKMQPDTEDDEEMLAEDDEQEEIIPTISTSRLQRIVTDDLCQGGVLSRSLPGYEERPAQVEMATLVSHAINQHEPAIIEASTGTGKDLDVETPIPTLEGWKQMGELVVGDVVFDEQGKPTRVTAAFNVMYNRPCYEVVFSDGSSLIADAEHEWVSYTCADRVWGKQPRSSTSPTKNFITLDKLAALDQLIASSNNHHALSVDEGTRLIQGHRWSVYQAARQVEPVIAGVRPVRYPAIALLTAIRDRLARDLDEQRRNSRTYTLITTEKMAATLTIGSTKRANHAIAVAGPLALPDVDLPIAPYFLGVWLGDGSSYNNQITSADPSLIPEIEKDGYTVRSLQSHPYLYAVDDENGKANNRWQPCMTKRLRTLNLLYNKHIPASYLRASEEQRRALLAGLLDTDGTVSRHGAVEFTTTSSQLAQGVYELACSLGFRPSLRQGNAYLYGKDCGPKWMIAFTTNQLVFRLERKRIAQQERLRNYNPERNRYRYVVAVREVPSRPVRCIQVDAPSHLYLAGKSMIPTHNSLAYLVPVVRSGQVAIVSTANKALQEQLFYKDIPFVQRHIKYFEAALVKGVSNYICLDRVENERVGMQTFAKNRDFQRLYDFINEPETGINFSGDFETLDFQLPKDIRSRIATDNDQCAWKKCTFYEDCYVHQMRERAASAQVIVVNHTLLLLDAAMGGFLLPERDVIILDEAHHLEEEATRSFTITIHPNQFQTLLAQHMLKTHSSLSLQDKAMQAAQMLWFRVEQRAEAAVKGRVNMDTPVEEGLKLATAVSDLAVSMEAQRPKDLSDKDDQLYDKLVKRAQNLAEDIRTVFSVADLSKFVYYIERVEGSVARGFVFQASAAPLDVTLWLKERLFDKTNVISTSATLATIGPNPTKPQEKGPNFFYFRRRIGLDPVERSDVLERILPLTFDYESNALLYLPRDLPAPAYGPGSDDYMLAIAREMYRLVKLSRGRAFLLFSSKRMLDRAYELMLPHLPYPMLKQGDMTRIELTRRFREEEGSILFGLKSFWEGVDIAGDALSLVVIDKLPFDPPDDPVHEARVAMMKAAGENWFGTYVLPQAVLRLKQGIGRLLRTREDRGVMAILDTRLHTKGYGKQVIDALPPARRTSNIRDVERFFS